MFEYFTCMCIDVLFQYKSFLGRISQSLTTRISWRSQITRQKSKFLPTYQNIQLVFWCKTVNSHNVIYGYSLFSSLEGLYLQCKAKFGRTGNSTETCKRILPFSYRCTYINTLKRSYDLLSINWVINACLTNLYTNILNVQFQLHLSCAYF